MKIVPAQTFILNESEVKNALQKVVQAARTCYKAEKDNPTIEEDIRTYRNLISKGHEAMLEHAVISAKIITDRGVTHELVRHRIASFAQESTRYCNYSKGKFNNEITVIEPCFWSDGTDPYRGTKYKAWYDSCLAAEKAYLCLIEFGATAQEARSVLPNSLKTEIVVTMNLREWRHFFRLRYFGTTGKPHPQMVEVSKMLYDQFNIIDPILLEDLNEKN